MINDENEQDIVSNILFFGKTNIKKLVILLYMLGALLVGYLSFIYGQRVAITNTYFENIRDGSGMLTPMQVYNIPLGIVVGTVTFIFLLVLLKIICELILLVFKVLQNHMKMVDAK